MDINKIVIVFVLRESASTFISSAGEEDVLKQKLHDAFGKKYFEESLYWLNMNQVRYVYFKKYENEKPGFTRSVRIPINR